MGIKYQNVDFLLTFNEHISFFSFPTFVFHSILGKELRRLCCLFPKRECRECSLRMTCAYSWMFNTPLEKDNVVLPGRNKGTHPYVMLFQPNSGKNTEGGVLSVTLIGKASEYLPYIYFSLKKAGTIGVFKKRTKFSIDDVTTDNTSILTDPENIDLSNSYKVWNRNTSSESSHRKIVITFESPFRSKIKGRYVDHIELHDIFYILSAREFLLNSLWGDSTDKKERYKIDTIKKMISGFHVLKSSQVWKDYSYYSARQRGSIKLGGVVGDMVVEGDISSDLYSLLKFGELFHGGKNTSFGFGKLTIKEDVQ